MKLWQIFFVHSVRSNIFASTWSDALHCSEVHANSFLGEKLTQKVSAKNVENTLIICEMQRLYEGLDLYLFAHICTDEPTKRSIRKQWLPFVSESCWLKFSNCVNICGKSSPVEPAENGLHMNIDKYFSCQTTIFYCRTSDEQFWIAKFRAETNTIRTSQLGFGQQLLFPSKLGHLHKNRHSSQLGEWILKFYASFMLRSCHFFDSFKILQFS